jgi:signal transduction histidine kinase
VRAKDGSDPARLFLPSFLPQWLVDIGPVLVIVLPPLAIVASRGDAGGRRGALAVYVFLAALPLIWRRRFPLTVLAITATVAFVSGYGPVYVLPMAFAVFNAATCCERRVAVAAALAAFASQVGALALHGQHNALRFTPLVSRGVTLGFALALGLYVTTRQAYVGGLRDRAARAERERELLASQAVADERVRIARELHDVVAHNISLMVVQAQAVGALAHEERERSALGQIASLGRDGLAEMHRMLGVLRPGDEELEPELSPQPGVADVEQLVERARSAGLDIALRVEGEPRPLPAGADLSAYRIVQEALTNVIKHAGGASAEVTIRYGRSALELSVADDGRGASAGGSNGSGGHGLVGMRERVALFGGELESGPGTGGRGHLLSVRLPFGS